MATIREKNLDDEAKKKLRKGDQKRKKRQFVKSWMMVPNRNQA